MGAVTATNLQIKFFHVERKVFQHDSYLVLVNRSDVNPGLSGKLSMFKNIHQLVFFIH